VQTNQRGSENGASRRFAAAVVICLVPVASVAVLSGAQLGDGTPIPVRLVGVINSETTRSGQPLQFVVVCDVMSDSEILIERGAPVTGVVTNARRAEWGWTHHKPRLAFTYRLTVARDGQMVGLRASAVHGGDEPVTVDRYGRHHQIRWATGGDAFTAYVDGTYEVQRADQARGVPESARTNAPRGVRTRKPESTRPASRCSQSP